jgi:hypothetical protein
MHICRKRNHDHPYPQIRLNGQILEVKNTHKILGITFDNRLTLKTHTTEAKAAKGMNVMRSLAGTYPGHAASNSRNAYFLSTGVRQHSVRISHRWTIETATLGIDLGMVECVKELEHPPWINNKSDNMMPKRSGSTRIRAELETTIEDQGLREYARVYTDGSVMESGQDVQL